jgi:hypothetical protein
MQFLGVIAFGLVFFYGLYALFAVSAGLGLAAIAVIASAIVTSLEFPSWRG